MAGEEGKRIISWRGFLVVLAAAVAASFTTAVARLDYVVLDAQFRFLRAEFRKPVMSDVVLVGIDDASTERFPEPLALWHRHLADFLRAMRTAGPAVVGFDIVFPDRSYETLLPGYDRELLAAMVEARQAFPLVLGLTVGQAGEARRIYPPYLSLAGPEGAGFVLLEADADGVTRRFAEPPGDAGQPVRTLVGQMARQLGHEPGAGVIDFARGPQFAYVPFHEVVTWQRQGAVETLRETFGGRPVLVGTVFRFEDRHRQPVDLAAWEEAQDLVKPGVLLHAQALRSIVNGGLIRPVPPWLVAFFSALAALLWFVSNHPLRGLSWFITFAFVALLVSTALLFAGHYLPAGGLITAGAVGTLGRIGADTAVQIRERQRLRRAFAGYVSPSIMQEILDGRLGEGLGGARFRLCVMFADIRGFTARSEAMAPELVIGLLNRYFSEMTAAIHDHGGTVDKFMGDGIMAFFGAPKPLEQPGVQAWQAAQAMLERLAALNAELTVEGIERLRIGIGLHLGDAVVGHIGSETRHEYTAIGDVVNVASRIEALTKETGYPLLLTRAVVEEIGRRDDFDYLGMRELKGHTPIEVFGWRPAADAARHAATGEVVS